MPFSRVLGLLALALVLGATTPTAVAEDAAEERQAVREARERAAMPGSAEGLLEWDVLRRHWRYAEVFRANCWRAGRIRHRCRILAATYDGDIAIRGTAIMRGYSFVGRSYRYRYRITGELRSCSMGTVPLECRSTRVVRRGNSRRSLFPAPNDGD